MNLTLPEIAVFALCLALALFRWRAGLFALWPFILLVFPTARIFLGFPLYLYDIVVVLILLRHRREILALRWRLDCAPWHYVFFALILVTGIVWPLIVLPASAQLVWITGHALLAYSTIAIVALAFCAGGYSRERVMLGYGVAASIVVLGIIGLIQFGSPTASAQIAATFYRDFGDDAFVHSEFYAQIAAQRAAGPYGSANIMGIVAVLGALAVSLLVRQRVLIVAVFASAAIAVLSSVSRQAMIGMILAGVVYYLMSRRHERVGASVFAVAAAPLLMAGFLASDYSTSVLERFGRWGEGIEEDDNFTARYVAGPANLASTIAEFPSILVLGTGPEIGKLASAGVDTGGREQGFVSISYLLFLYQYGVFGLLAGVAMIVQAWRNLRHVPASHKARAAALLTAVTTFYLTDNAPNISEPVTMLCLFGIGLVSGCAIRAAPGHASAEGPSFRPPVVPAVLLPR